ncbi:hypothetical protein C0Q70_06666 [Pomacea canaliculata]|uniref:Uncharacterized protein n=1 Tax=Pomacea canaliculata TaxID=400727 RepID=A0A2T7PCW9_POMCA|nr:hypothetical protein C0Q70_06666 [Pomacea canaliculata]
MPRSSWPVNYIEVGAGQVGVDPVICHGVIGPCTCYPRWCWERMTTQTPHTLGQRLRRGFKSSPPEAQGDPFSPRLD